MEYTVNKLGVLAGVSTRTLRYYDEIGILKPARINSSGYRIYGRAEVDRLQQILFYRELGLELERIREIMAAPDFDPGIALRQHREQLLARREQLNRLIANVEKTIALAEGRTTMSDNEKFEGFKRRLIEENEQKYGAEIRQKYGDAKIDASNAKMMNMTQEQYDEMQRLNEGVHEALAEALAAGGDPAGEAAQRAASLHKQWLCFSWSEYTAEAHANLARMYVEDERFKAYYEKQPGTTELLRDAVLIYTGGEQTKE